MGSPGFRKVHQEAQRYVRRPRGLALCQDKGLAAYGKAEIVDNGVHKRVADGDIGEIAFLGVLIFRVQVLVKPEKVLRHAEQVLKDSVLYGPLGELPGSFRNRSFAHFLIPFPLLV